jgi:tryptophanyl-tRNA synthetase
MRIFSGIQPTGAKHLGNYSGGFRQYAATQERGEAFFCVVDLHSITVEHDPAELRETTLDLAAMLFATGLDPRRSTVFVQSHNPAHAEAAWLLGAVASFGELRRMTQFKDKSEAHEFVSSGLFTYPVLMAADILLYQTDIVPIGDDQRQHLELTRDVAQRFNARFGEVLRVPEGVYPEDGARIMDLADPEKKMSTSTSSDMGKVLMTDPPAVVRKKIMSAVTDTGREVRRGSDKPGITNLIDVMSVASGRSPEDIEREFEGQGYGTFKAAVAEAVIACLDPIRRRYDGLRADPAELERLLSEGARKAIQASEPTLRAMYEHMGFARVGAKLVSPSSGRIPSPRPIPHL